MRLAIIFFTVLAARVFGIEPTEIEATVSRVDGERGAFSYRIEYKSRYAVKLGVGKGRIFQQRIVRFLNGEDHVGSYFYWQEVGSHLPQATTSQDLLVKPREFTEVRITDRFYDLNWGDSRMTESERGRWFTQTWHLFNSCNPSKKKSEYYLCNIEDIPKMNGYLRGAGFTAYSVLEHSFSLSNTIENFGANQKQNKSVK